MTDKRIANFLLLVIAVCLVLIVIKLYDDVDLVAEAHAQNDPSTVGLMGWYPGAKMAGGSIINKGWKNVLVDDKGRLVTTAQK
jgi:hypothetical protein